MNKREKLGRLRKGEKQKKGRKIRTKRGEKGKICTQEENGKYVGGVKDKEDNFKVMRKVLPERAVIRFLD